MYIKKKKRKKADSPRMLTMMSPEQGSKTGNLLTDCVLMSVLLLLSFRMMWLMHFMFLICETDLK